jgi:hypothetical protein
MPSGVFHQPGKASASTHIGLPSNKQGLFLPPEEEPPMQSDDEKILKVTKEIVVKFIELGRVSPTNFDENFRKVYWTVKNTVIDAQLPDLGADRPLEEPHDVK